ncbi:hypothetical protein D3C80_1463190 [compost metagenome]
MRCKGTLASMPASASGEGASRRMPSVSAIGPGEMALTRTPSSPHSMASTRVIMSMPALAAQACTWYMVGLTPCGAVMLMTLAPGLRSMG